MRESRTTRSDLPLISTNGVTPREAQVVGWVSKGLTNGAIASQLQISSRTVQKHLERVFRKLGVRSRSELVARAYLALVKKDKDR
jgi:DNA-binding CsgD family transcriptional regulator